MTPRWLENLLAIPWSLMGDLKLECVIEVNERDEYFVLSLIDETRSKTSVFWLENGDELFHMTGDAVKRRNGAVMVGGALGFEPVGTAVGFMLSRHYGVF